MKQHLIFRIFQSTDNILEINSLLLSAYKPLAEKGMRYAASHEDAEATQKHIENGECHLGILDGKIAACAILRVKTWKDLDPECYKSSYVTTFGRFAVKPELQGTGLGSKMMDILENRAKELGYNEISLDTSEHAHHLIKMYENRGYRFVQFHQWNITNYRSVVMSKSLQIKMLL